MDQLILRRSTLMNGLLKSIQDKARTERATGAPSHDPSREDINDERHINEAGGCS